VHPPIRNYYFFNFIFINYINNICTVFLFIEIFKFFTVCNIYLTISSKYNEMVKFVKKNYST